MALYKRARPSKSIFVLRKCALTNSNTRDESIPDRFLLYSTGENGVNKKQTNPKQTEMNSCLIIIIIVFFNVLNDVSIFIKHRVPWEAQVCRRRRCSTCCLTAAGSQDGTCSFLYHRKRNRGKNIKACTLPQQIISLFIFAYLDSNGNNASGWKFLGIWIKNPTSASPLLPEYSTFPLKVSNEAWNKVLHILQRGTHEYDKRRFICKCNRDPVVYSIPGIIYAIKMQILIEFFFHEKKNSMMTIIFVKEQKL